MIQLIGVAYSDYKDDKIVGFRILDTRQGCARNIAYADCLKAVAKSDFPVVVGLKYDKEKNELVGSNGAISRYAKISLSKGIVSDSLVIIAESKGKGYVLCDGSGILKFVQTHEAIAMADIIGLANGKVIKKQGVLPYISPIEGKYATVNNDLLKSIEQR